MTIQDLLNDIASTIHGTTINKIPAPYSLLNRAARTVLLDCDPKETQRIVQLAQVFNGVYDYALPADVKGDKIIDIRPQAGRTPSDIFTQGYAQSFDAQKLYNSANKINVQWNTGIKSLRIEAPTLTAPITICDTGVITGWTNITPTLDQTNNVAGSGALVLDLPASSPSYIENSTLTAIDLSAHENKSTLFLWVYLPTASAITSINLRWGSSSSNYFTSTVTTTQQGTVFQNGWNLLAFDWKTATETGTAVTTAINYLRVTFVTDATVQVGVKIDNFTSTLGYIFETQYYSKYLFRNPSTNAFKETITDATENAYLINLDTESYNLLFNKFAYYVAQALQGADSDYDATVWDNEYKIALEKYRTQNPGESMKKGETYYKLPRKGFNKFSSGIWNR